MEVGIKKKKIVVIIVTGVIVAILGIMYGLYCENEISFEKSNEAFFRRLLSRTEKGDIEILSLEAYYKDDYHYYDVVYKAYDYELDEICEFTQVYYGRYDGMDDSFNPNNVHPADEEKAYKPFLDAKKNGVNYSFTPEEIEKYMKEYYENK